MSLCILLFSGCTANMPEPLNLESTVQSNIDTIIQDKNLVDEEMLQSALDKQAEKISSDMDEKLNLIMTMVADPKEPTPNIYIATPTLSIGSSQSGTQAAPVTDGNCVVKFAYLSDVTFPDGAMTLPRTTFTKSWYIQNIGTCDLDNRYKLVYVSGDKVGTAEEFPLFSSPKLLKPGESTVVSVKLVAPENLSTYSTYWALQTPDGKIVRGGEAQDVLLSSIFKVGNQYNFQENLSGAICSDNSGLFFCGSSDRSSGRGTAYYAASPTVESNYAGQPSIIISPPAAENGTTRVTFGPIFVPRDTWLRAAISCPPNAPSCDNYVRLFVQSEGLAEQRVTETQENNDGFTTQWNIQLGDYGYHEQSLLFIFEVQAIGGSDKDDMIIIQVPRLTDQPPIL